MLTSASNAWPLPPSASLHASTLDAHLVLNLWIGLGLVALAHVLLLAALTLGRGAGPRGVVGVEFLPLAALALIFFGLAARAERLWAAMRYTGAAPAAMQVEATGVQFAWYFRYPGADATFGLTRPGLVDPGAANPLGLDPVDPHSPDDIVVSELVLPAGREIDLRLHAQDVIHGFFVPALRLKQNAVPGQTLHVHFTPTAPGTYAILCTQVCGLGHFRMTANLRILSAEDFAGWLTSKSKAATR